VKFKKPSYQLILGVIIFLGALLRVVGINSSETGFYVDEAALGYNAKSLIETGTDEYGQAWPLAFRSFGDFKSPLFIYSAIPLVKLLSIPLGVRLTSALWGIVTIYWTAELAREMIKKKEKAKWVGLIAGLTLALSPWHINLSRHAIEAVMATAFWSLGLLMLIRKKYPAGIVALSLAALSYHSAKYAVPLLLLTLAGWQVVNKKIKIKRIDKKWLIAGVALVVMLAINLQPFSNARAGGVSLFGVNGWLKTVRDVAASYLAYFSPRVLNLGDWQVRNSITGVDNVPVTVLILFYIGIYQTIKRLIEKREEKELILLSALLLSPLPASATIDPFHSIRSLIMVVPLTVMAGVGGSWLMEKVNKKKLKMVNLVVVALVIWQTLLLTERILVQNTMVCYEDWAWGYEELINKTIELETDKYQAIYVDTTDASAIYSTWLVFGEVETSEKIPHENGYYEPVKWQSPEKLVIKGGKTINFKEIYWPKDQLKENTLYIGSYKRFDETALEKAGAEVVEEIKDKTGKTWWMIVATPKESVLELD